MAAAGPHTLTTLAELVTHTAVHTHQRHKYALHTLHDLRPPHHACSVDPTLPSPLHVPHTLHAATNPAQHSVPPRNASHFSQVVIIALYRYFNALCIFAP